MWTDIQYRIKVIETKSGVKSYIPQWRYFFFPWSSFLGPFDSGLCFHKREHALSVIEMKKNNKTAKVYYEYI